MVSNWPQEGEMSIDWCPKCNQEVEVVKTVPWQADVCKECGADVEVREA
jgi:transcription elongation factor Elf1